MVFPIGECLILLLGKYIDKHLMENDIILFKGKISGRKYKEIVNVWAMEEIK